MRKGLKTLKTLLAVVALIAAILVGVVFVSFAGEVRTGNGIIYDVDGVVQGEDGMNFAEAAQVSSIRLDYERIDDVNNARFQRISSDAGFVTIPGSELWYSTSGRGAGSDKGMFAVYDNRISGKTIRPHQDNFFPGDLFSFTYPDAAILPDGSRADVVLTYSNMHIVLQSSFYGNYMAQTYIASPNMLRAGNSYGSGSTVTRNGLQVDINIKVVDQFGNIVEGTFMYPMTDIDVSRAGLGSFAELYDSGIHHNYSESMSVNSGYVGDIYVPDAEGVDEQLLSYSYNPFVAGYKTGVENYGDGVRFFGLGRSDQDPGTYYSGFVSVADNTGGGVNITLWTSGSRSAPVRTNLLNGKQVINHAIVSSTTAGGTIQTTKDGNADGTLSDGSEVLGPGTVVVPEGKTMRYTMTPMDGFAIEEIQIGDETDGSVNKTTISNEQLEALRLGEISEIPVTMNTGLRERLGTTYYDVGERIGSLVYDSTNNAYIYEFPDNNYHHRIHVSWKPITLDLRVTKRVPLGADDTAFPFTLELTEGSQYALPASITSVKGGTRSTAATDDPIPFSLQADESILFNGIPIGTTYLVSEGQAAGRWRLKSETNTSGVMENGTSSYEIAYADASENQRAALVWTDGTVLYNVGAAIPLSAATVLPNGEHVTYGAATINQRQNPSLAWEENGKTYYYDNSHTTSAALSEVPCLDAEVENEALRDLTVRKTVTGTFPDHTKQWTFTFLSQAVAGRQLTVARSDGTTQTITAGVNGRYDFQLKHDEALTFLDLPLGADYSVTEADTDHYKESFRINSGTPVIGRSTGEQTLMQDSVVDYLNDCFFLPPPTGLFENGEWAWMLLFTGAALSLLLWRKKRNGGAADGI